MTVNNTDLGQLDRAGERAVLRFTRRFAHAPDKVWRALTEPDQLATWFPSTIDGDRKAGARLRFSFEDMPGLTMEGDMLAFDPPSLLEFAWGDDILRFELRPEGDGTVLDFSDTIAEMGKAARDAAGWHTKFAQLAQVLDGGLGANSDVEGWNELNPKYKERFGPDASTMGPPEEWERVHGEGSQPN